MKLFLRFLFDVRVLSVLGLLALAIFLFLGADMLRLSLMWAVGALLLALLAYACVWVGKKMWAARAARRLAAGIEAEGAAGRATEERDRAEVGNLRARLDEAVKTITTSKLGQSVGKAALYELPWYMVIGNPAAGKSTAIAKSGLNFPFADKQGSAVQGIGGTRNCDWFFTTEGILLDTAGRYSVHEEDRRQWLGFLRLLKRTRPLAPINGILIAVSIAEISSASPDAANLLAKNLRQRVQELTETLGVFAPVYLVFTKMDLVSGFVEFFADRDSDERNKVWGATMPYKPQASDGAEDAVTAFERHFDELGDGLKESTLARMSLARGQALPVGVLSFPLEFQALKPSLRAFVATLFEENPFQFKPVFRGFYFTSAVQEGEAQSHASADVARQFGLQAPRLTGSATVASGAGYFLRELFSKVVFADRGLVKQYASRTKQRMRLAFFGGGVAVLALALGAWAWAYQGNRALMQSVDADLRKVVSLQAERTDLASRLEALEVLQQRIEQLQALRDNRPLGLSLGLYQGEAIERKLRVEYFEGVRQVLLQPVAQGIEGYLAEVNQNASALQPVVRAPLSAAAESQPAPSLAASGPTAAPAVARSRFTDLSPGNTEEAYNALKTYLMMAERERMEQSHLADQLTRFWRVWLDERRGTLPRDQLLRSAERLMAFSLAHLHDEAFPLITPNLGLVDQTRDNLRKVMRGMPARERVYAEVKARAATRYPSMTVARILTEAGLAPEPGTTPAVAGSYAISGTFTRQAWEGYVQDAIKDAATTELQRVDWVLNAAQKDDLSLEGSPEQIRAALTELYKNEYVKEWQRFVQGVTVAQFVDYADATRQLNRLGEPRNSPLKAVFDTLFEQTSWDNPSLLNERLGKAQKGIVQWFKQSVLNMAPSRVQVGIDVTGGDAKIPMGPVGREFAGLTQLMVARDGKATGLAEYLRQLSAVREAFNTLNNQGDKGPGSTAMMVATLEGAKSPLSDALNYVDSSLLAAMPASQRNALRPLLVRPLIQAYAVLIPSAETDLNRRWEAEVVGPFQRTVAGKYPFNTTARVEAGSEEIAALFGPAGAIAKYGTDTLGRLVTRRGATVEARTWADHGVTLRPEFVEGYERWVAPLDGVAAGGAAGGAAAAAAAQTAFQILPQGAPGLLEYTITVDGQSLRYRNAAATWTDMVWPNPTPQPGVRITGITLEGKQLDFLDERGAFGMNKMFDQAKIRKLPNGDNELTWSNGPLAVTVHLRLLKAPGAAPAATAAAPAAPAGGGVAALRGLKLPALVVGKDGMAAPPPAAAPAAPAATAASVASTGEKR